MCSMYCIVCTVCTTLAHQPCVHFWFGIAEHCNKCGNKGNPLAPKGGPGALKGRPEAPKGDQKTTRGQLQRQQYTCKNSMFDPTEIDSISVGKTPLFYHSKSTQKVQEGAGHAGHGHGEGGGSASLTGVTQLVIKRRSQNDVRS